MTAAAPSGVVTFLFTDVEGSTRRWESDADEMRIALAAHDEVLRGAIEAHGGWLFKHTGDGVCAAFASPRSAVDAAVAAQLQLELPVRMGIATGEAELREADYFGAVLNRAARVMAAGHGGQILLADSTAGLLSGVDLVDLGPRRLRDVPTAVGVFQVRAAGLQADFPALRALDASPGNLRAATTSFIGRESEVAELHAAVKAHRLVTLTGVGGVGKTRLALEVAARLADEFPDGVWFFELAAVTDPAASHTCLLHSMIMPLDIGYTRRYTAYIYHIHAYITGVTKSTKQLLINTNEDSDLSYKGNFGLVGTTASLDAEALYSARDPAEYEQLWADRRAAYEYLPTNDEHWQTALGAQRALAANGRHRAVGIADLLTATLTAAHRLAVVHYDADFETAATVLMFEHRWVLPRGSV